MLATLDPAHWQDVRQTLETFAVGWIGDANAAKKASNATPYVRMRLSGRFKAHPSAVQAS